MFILKISNELYRDHPMIKEAVENINMLKNQSPGEDFKNLFPQDECKLNQVIVKQPVFTRAQIFQKIGIEEVKKDKRCRVLCELGSVKKIFFAISFHKSKYLKESKLRQEIYEN